MWIYRWLCGHTNASLEQLDGNLYCFFCTLAIQQQQIHSLSAVFADLRAELKVLKENGNGAHTTNKDHSSYVQVTS